MRIVIERIRTYGPTAVEPLTALLDGGDPRIDAMAAAALAALGPTARPAIPALGRALHRRVSGAAAALAATKETAALSLLVAEANLGARDTLLALLRMGADGQRAAVAVLARSANPRAFGFDLATAVKYGSEDQSALVSPLLALAKDGSATVDARVVAIRAVGVLHVDPTALRPTLRDLARSSAGEVTTAARRALDQIGDPLLIPALIDQMTQDTGRSSLQAAEALARLGPAASAATPALVARVRGAAWDERARFVRALGAIGDVRAVPCLIEALKSADWRVVMAAARALGRLGTIARGAAPALEATAQTHWLPRVRKYAAEGRDAVLSSAPAPARTGDGGADRSQVRLSYRPLENQIGCKAPTGEGWLGQEDFAADLPAGLDHLRGKPRGVVVTQAVDGGWLVGTSRGEWWGEVTWVKDGREETLVQGNIFAFLPRAPSDFWLVHSTMEGTVSRLTRGEGGAWSVRPLVELPAEPRAVRATLEGGLGIATRAGVLTIDRTGGVTSYECVPRSPDLPDDDDTAPVPRPAHVKVFPVPTERAGTGMLTVGPDRALWFTEPMANKIGRVTLQGAFTEFPLPQPDSLPHSILTGPDGALWFGEIGGRRLGRITPAGSIKEYAIPIAGCRAHRLGWGKGGLWFTCETSLGRMTPAGKFSEHKVTETGERVSDVAPDNKGGAWFSYRGASGVGVGHLDPDGRVSKHRVRKTGIPETLLLGRDGVPWLLVGEPHALLRATASETVEAARIPGLGEPRGLGRGADGTLWITGPQSRLGCKKVTGAFERFRVPPGHSPSPPVIGPDGAVWYADENPAVIVRVAP